MKKIFISTTLFLICFCTAAQDNIFSKFTKAQNRSRFYNNLVDNSIRKSLALPLNDSTAEYWQDAFASIELINYKQDWIKPKIKTALDTVIQRYKSFWGKSQLGDSTGINNDIEFERSLLEMLYSVYPTDFKEEIYELMRYAVSNKIFAMCAEYLLQSGESKFALLGLTVLAKKKQTSEDVILQQLVKNLNDNKEKSFKKLKDIFKPDYLKGSTILYSIQRKNRNYPGIVIIKDTTGIFVKNTDGQLFSLPQLARSVSNMPGYLTNGNTPQGIFRMYGFAVSKSNFIGPTENIQLTMPYETSVQQFLKDSILTDSIWTEDLYKKLLPKSWKDYEPAMGSYYASKIGRTEIIAHGTAVDPEFYKGQSYYPLTPTAGCLCTKEIWYADGTRAVSNQQLLVDAVKKAGGADGYVIVIELDDERKPVMLQDILPYLK